MKRMEMKIPKAKETAVILQSRETRAFEEDLPLATDLTTTKRQTRPPDLRAAALMAWRTLAISKTLTCELPVHFQDEPTLQLCHFMTSLTKMLSKLN